MSREGLIPQLQTRGIQLNELKYSQQSVSVYQGTYQTYVAAIKVLALVPGADYTQLEGECRTLISLSHPNILRLYDCFWEQQESTYYFVIVTEWCDKDLAKDVMQRAEHHYPWKEEELWKLASEIVGALTYMQEQGISHRDIKPENIFLVLGKTAKIGDFGSARTFLSDGESTDLTGTPLYLSPKLREAYVNRNPQVVHNSFKSDVYSLGLTLLSLALSAPPMSLAKVRLTNAEVQAVINTVRYSELFRSMLTWMLSVEEDTRCDFKALKLWLDNKDSRNREPGPSKTGTDLTTSQMLSVSKSKSEPGCMQCGKVVDRYGTVAQCEVVQLYCEPYQHMFCSRECFKAYLSYGQFKCPQCGVEIPEETVVFYLPEEPKRIIPKVPEEGQRRIEKPSPVGLSNPAATEERMLPALTSKVATAPKQKSEPVCMQCGKVVDRYGEIARCEVVQLYCEPYQHLFCSRDCFKAYLSNGWFKCPQCGVEIPEETVMFYLPEQPKRTIPKVPEEGQRRIEKPSPVGLSNPAATEERKLPALTSQVATSPKTKSEPVCMQCGKVVDRYGEVARCEVVQLYCEPYQHLFCSRDCFKAYLSYGQFKCPQCKTDIPQETLDFYWIDLKRQQVRDPRLGDGLPSEGDRRGESDALPLVKKPIDKPSVNAPPKTTSSKQNPAASKERQVSLVEESKQVQFNARSAIPTKKDSLMAEDKKSAWTQHPNTSKERKTNPPSRADDQDDDTCWGCINCICW